MGRVEREEKKKGVESGTTLSAKGGKGKWREESRKLEREEEDVSLDFFFPERGAPASLRGSSLREHCGDTKSWSSGDAQCPRELSSKVGTRKT